MVTLIKTIAVGIHFLPTIAATPFLFHGRVGGGFPAPHPTGHGDFPHPADNESIAGLHVKQAIYMITSLQVTS